MPSKYDHATGRPMEGTIWSTDVTNEVERYLKYEAALRKIAGWQGRATGATHMRTILQKIAEEALS